MKTVKKPIARRGSCLPDKEKDSPLVYRKKMEILKKTIQKALEKVLGVDDDF